MILGIKRGGLADRWKGRGRRGLSLRGLIIVIAASASVLVSALFLLGYSLVFSSSFGSSLRGKTDLIAARLSDTLSIPLWNFSDEVCARIVASELGDEDLIAVVLRDERGRIVAAMGRSRRFLKGEAQPRPRELAPAQLPAIAAAARYAAEVPVRYGSAEIGLVTVYSGGESAFRDFTRRVGETAILAFAVSGLVAWALFLAFDRLVSRRILALGRGVGRFAARDFSARTPEGREDELGELERAFNRMADTIQRYGEDLEGLVRERTGQLVESEKLAFLGSLVAGVAHEVNTPIGVSVTAASHTRGVLAAISRGYAEGSMEETAFLAQLKDSIESLDIIELNLARAAEFIRTFKQLAADQAVAERRRIKLAHYLGEIVLSLRPKLKRTAVAVEIDCPKELEALIVPSALYQIVTNLIVNSLMHAYEEGQRGQILISARRVEGLLELRYRDDGKGIAPEHLDRVFEPFFTTKRERGGTGLGLYIIKTIVLKLGGEVRCASEYGKGVEFTIRLPDESRGVVDGR